MNRSQVVVFCASLVGALIFVGTVSKATAQPYDRTEPPSIVDLQILKRNNAVPNPPDGWECSYVDLNHGVTGSPYLYLAWKRKSDDDEQAITDLVFAERPPNEEWKEWDSTDLNSGTGGKPIYAFWRRDGANEIKFIDFIVTKYKSPPDYREHYKYIYQDLNEGCGADTPFIWGYYSYGELFHGVLPRPIGDLQIVERDDPFPGRDLPEGWELSFVDLNEGVGGKYIYMLWKRSESPYVQAITHLEFESFPKKQLANPRGASDWEWSDIDLNSGTGGDVIYAFWKKVPGKPAIDNIMFVVTKHKDLFEPRPRPPFHALPVIGLERPDLNAGCGADTPFIWPYASKRAVDPDEPDEQRCLVKCFRRIREHFRRYRGESGRR